MGDAFTKLLGAALAGADLTVQRELLADGLRTYGVSKGGVRTLMEHVRDGVVLFERGDDTRRSRIGGPAQLPPGVDWPLDPDGEPLTFIATIDFDEHPKLAPLPDHGVLLVFWSDRYFEWERKDFGAATRVFWVPKRIAPIDAPTPTGVEEYDAVPLTGVLMPVLGTWQEIKLRSRDYDALNDAYEDELEELYDHQLLGASRDHQGPVFDDVELPGKGWMLLAQIEATYDLSFGDLGALFLVIREVDLDARRFDRVIGIRQTG
jgi:uncharacterized protein YwqG